VLSPQGKGVPSEEGGTLPIKRAKPRRLACKKRHPRARESAVLFLEKKESIAKGEKEDIAFANRKCLFQPQRRGESGPIQRDFYGREETLLSCRQKGVFIDEKTYKGRK